MPEWTDGGRYINIYYDLNETSSHTEYTINYNFYNLNIAKTISIQLPKHIDGYWVKPKKKCIFDE